MAEFNISETQIRGRDIAEVTRVVIDTLDFPQETRWFSERSFPEQSLPDKAYIYHPRNLSRPDHKSRHLEDTHPDVAIFCPPVVNIVSDKNGKVITQVQEGSIYTVVVNSKNTYPYYKDPLNYALKDLDRIPAMEILLIFLERLNAHFIQTSSATLLDHPHPVYYHPPR